MIICAASFTVNLLCSRGWESNHDKLVKSMTCWGFFTLITVWSFFFFSGCSMRRSAHPSRPNRALHREGPADLLEQLEFSHRWVLQKIFGLRRSVGKKRAKLRTSPRVYKLHTHPGSLLLVVEKRKSSFLFWEIFAWQLERVVSSQKKWQSPVLTVASHCAPWRARVHGNDQWEALLGYFPQP